MKTVKVAVNKKIQRKYKTHFSYIYGFYYQGKARSFDCFKEGLMARNSEKQYGRLNRLLLSKDKEEYEKKHPKRPNLHTLNTVEEIQKWLPGIKDDMNFYLMKSRVICYSDEHIEECKQKVVQLEKEYKAFVRKISQLTPGTLEAVPWTNRAYKRKHLDSGDQPSEKKEFKPILTPILDQEPKIQEKVSIPVSLPLMNEPLTFTCNSQNSSAPDISSNWKSETKEISLYKETADPQPLLSLMDQPITFKSNSKNINNSHHTKLLSPGDSLSHFSGYEYHNNENASSCNNENTSNCITKTEKSLVNYESSTDSDS
ncbi:hypothetical protein JTE90_020313 [Oedothorax gibbosus]|uniref:Uncharacterized protein n=1 Tax=Oedothorax gibbosus TaxID=931172 RepID=A0AAV6VR13_9ARAC|nr:hypothetical protein JTE90_020313 [Oedothorax gibbosus]